MEQNINESMERKAADIAVLNGRISTLKEHYEDVYAKLDTLRKAHADWFDKSFSPVPFVSIRQDSGIRDEFQRKSKYIDAASVQYVRLMDEYGRIKDLHPDMFDGKQVSILTNKE